MLYSGARDDEASAAAPAAAWHEDRLGSGSLATMRWLTLGQYTVANSFSIKPM